VLVFVPPWRIEQQLSAIQRVVVSPEVGVHGPPEQEQPDHLPPQKHALRGLELQGHMCGLPV